MCPKLSHVAFTMIQVIGYTAAAAEVSEEKPPGRCLYWFQGQIQTTLRWLIDKTGGGGGERHIQPPRGPLVALATLPRRVHLQGAQESPEALTHKPPSPRSAFPCLTHKQGSPDTHQNPCFELRSLLCSSPLGRTQAGKPGRPREPTTTARADREQG